MSGNAGYESDDLLQQYLLLHYGDASDIMPWNFGPREALHFPERCAGVALAEISPGDGIRALEVGCAVGRASFELTRRCREVVGLDFSAAFIHAARRLQSDGAHPAVRREEGELATPWTATVPAELDRTRVRFDTVDACALPEALEGFDLVLAANLLCRLPRPQAFLQRLPGLLKPGGVALITTPASWMEEYTPRSEWLGGRMDADGRPMRTLDGLRSVLGGSMRLRRTDDMTFLIREHARKFQWSVAQMSVWEKI